MINGHNSIHVHSEVVWIGMEMSLINCKTNFEMWGAAYRDLLFMYLWAKRTKCWDDPPIEWSVKFKIMCKEPNSDFQMLRPLPQGWLICRYLPKVAGMPILFTGIGTKISGVPLFLASIQTTWYGSWWRLTTCLARCARPQKFRIRPTQARDSAPAFRPSYLRG